MKSELNEIISMIETPDEKAMDEVKCYWDSLAKPVGSLGLGEQLITRIAGIQRTKNYHIDKKALVVFCADNGVLEEGVASSPQEITAFMAGNFLKGKTAVAIMCKKCGVDIFPIDVGMATDVFGVDNRKTSYGTKNIAKEPAMTYEEAVRAILTGAELAKQKKEEGYDILLAGEMGIGNTTTTTAVLCALLGKEAKDIAGRGAGLDDKGLGRKIDAINKALEVNKPDPSDAIDVVSKVGGFDIAAMAGFYLGAAANRLPVILDGVIASAAAVVATGLCPLCADYILESHMSKEAGMQYAMETLGKNPVLNAGFRLGEGTGAVAMVPFIELMDSVYKNLPVLETDF